MIELCGRMVERELIYEHKVLSLWMLHGIIIHVKVGKGHMRA